MEVENYKLVAPNVKQMHCNKKSSLLPVTDTIVIHYTGGGNAMSSAQLLARADTSVSAHLVIARSGQILQLLPFNVKAWHAGYSSLEGRQNVNNFSIGIELDNAGPLHRRGQGWCTWINKQIMPDEVFTTVEKGRASYWHSYPSVQIEALVEAWWVLKRNYPIRYIVGHSDITSRKLDPGPAFPWERFHDLLKE